MIEYKCPHCNNRLVPDPSNENKLLCYECKKRYDFEQIKHLSSPNINHTQHSEDPRQLPIGFSIISFIIGIVGLIGMLVPFINIAFIIISIIGIILGIVNVKRTKRKAARGKGLSIAGIVMNSIVIIVSLVITLTFAYASFSDKEKGSAINTSDPISSIMNKVYPKADNAYWNDGVVNVNGTAIKLGESTVQDLVNTGIFKDMTIRKNNSGQCAVRHPIKETGTWPYQNEEEDPEFIEVYFTEWVGDDVAQISAMHVAIKETSSPTISISNNAVTLETVDKDIIVKITYDENDELTIGQRPITSINVTIPSDEQRVF